MTEKTLDRRTFIYATGIAGSTFLAGCSGGEANDGGDGGSDGESGGNDEGAADERSFLDDEPDYDGWLDNASNYEGTVDWTDQDEVTVLVGYEGLSFDPAAIAISPGTEITWEWTGEGGNHNVVSEGAGPLDSELVAEEGHTYSYTFDDSGTFPYKCEPHAGSGMKGAVYVE